MQGHPGAEVGNGRCGAGPPPLVDAAGHRSPARFGGLGGMRPDRMYDASELERERQAGLYMGRHSSHISQLRNASLIVSLTR
jgi:hypothetical protein